VGGRRRSGRAGVGSGGYVPVPASPSPGVPIGTPEMSNSRFTPFAWIVFAYSLAVILWGYFLRISRSGDGCGTDWPLCHGAVIPAGAQFPTWVEFIHRVSSGLVLVLVVAMVIWALRAFPPRHAVRAGAVLALLLTVSESLFGAVLVVFGWVATDVSLPRILLRPVHVTNTFLLMGALALVPFMAGRGRGLIRPPGLSVPGALKAALRSRPGRILVPALLGVLALAWSGSWTGLANSAFPAETLAQGLGQYLAPEHLLIYLRMIHPVLALAVVGLLLWTARRLDREFEGPTVRILAVSVVALALAQLLVGPVTVLLLNPVWTTLLHLLLADLLWIALLLAAVAALLLDEGDGGFEPADEAGQEAGGSLQIGEGHHLAG
jgi:heme a synthase